MATILRDDDPRHALDATALSRLQDLDDLGAHIESPTTHGTGAFALESLALLRGTDPELLRELKSAALPRSFGPGELLFAEGQPTRSVFVIVSGAVEIRRTVRDTPLATLRAFEWCGVFGLLAGRRRAGHARALATTEVLELPAVVLVRLITQAPTVRATIKAHFNERLAQVFCGSSLLLGDINGPSATAADERGRVARAFVQAEYPVGRGVVLMEPDSTALHVVSHGQVRLSAPTLSDPVTLGRGQFFGIHKGNVALQPLARASVLSLLPQNCTSPLLTELPKRARGRGLFIDRTLFVGDTGIAGLV